MTKVNSFLLPSSESIPEIPATTSLVYWEVLSPYIVNGQQCLYCLICQMCQFLLEVPHWTYILAYGLSCHIHILWSWKQRKSEGETRKHGLALLDTHARKQVWLGNFHRYLGISPVLFWFVPTGVDFFKCPFIGAIFWSAAQWFVTQLPENGVISHYFPTSWQPIVRKHAHSSR